jgi:hypothetical protein
MNLKDPRREQYKRLKAQLIAKKRAVTFLTDQFTTGAVSAASFEGLNNQLENEKDSLIKRIDDLHLEDLSIKALEEEALKKSGRPWRMLKQLVKEGTY